jgi:protein arginine N-methyltransferase 2
MLLSLLQSKSSLESSSALILKQDDTSAAASTDAFLESKLRFTTGEGEQDVCLIEVQGEEIGVMMGWETGISMFHPFKPMELYLRCSHSVEETVRQLCDGHENENGLKILNIGFGLGIVRSSFIWLWENSF